jgi:hypothetical protein
LPNWSAACGATSIGVPKYRPSALPPMPAWVRKASAWRRIATCGTHPRTSTVDGTGPSAAGSTCRPTCRTVCHPGRSPNAVLRAGQAAGQIRTGIDLDQAVELLLGPMNHRWLLNNGPLTDAYADGIVDLTLTAIGTPR